MLSRIALERPGVFTASTRLRSRPAAILGYRLAGNAIWLPTALLPRFGVRWSVGTDGQVTTAFRVGDTPLELQLRLDAAGRIASLVFDRWGDPDNTGTFAQHPFGGEVTGYRSFQGLTIPSQGRLGWFYGRDRWPAGEFFRYQITDLEPVTSPAPLAGDRMWFRNRLVTHWRACCMRSPLHLALRSSRRPPAVQAGKRRQDPTGSACCAGGARLGRSFL